MNATQTTAEPHRITVGLDRMENCGRDQQQAIERWHGSHLEPVQTTDPGPYQADMITEVEPDEDPERWDGMSN